MEVENQLVMPFPIMLTASSLPETPSLTEGQGRRCIVADHAWMRARGTCIRKGRTQCFKGSGLNRSTQHLSKKASRGSNDLDLGSARAFLASACNERNSLILFERFKPSTLNFTVVCEEVFTATFRCDEAEAFFVVEPLHDTNFCFQCMS